MAACPHYSSAGCKGTDDGPLLREIAALRARIAELEGNAVKVKPLAWQKHNVDGTIWDAPSFGGGYVVRFDGKEWLTVKNIVVLARSEDSSAAKAAAQADHESRIRSALEDQPLHGPYGYLIKPHGLTEEHWSLATDPSDSDEETSIPLFAREEQELGVCRPKATLATASRPSSAAPPEGQPAAAGGAAREVNP